MKRNIKTIVRESPCPQKNLQEDVRNLNFDERRVQVLKARIIQLERQNQFLLDSIGQRAASFDDVDGILTSVANCCRKYISKEGCPGREVNVERADLILCVTQLETARRKMYHQQNKMAESGNLRPVLLQDCLMSSESSKTLPTPTTLHDASTGKLEHLNLKFVARLESQLSSLLRELVQLQHSLDDHYKTTSGGPTLSEDFLVNQIKEHQNEQIVKCCQLLQTSSENLMDLTMLHPSAPWGPLRRPLFQMGVTVEQVMAALPRSSSNSSKVKAIIEALIKAVNHKQLMCQQQIQALKAELKFHREVYSLQISYTHSLMVSLKEGYKNFHESTAETLFLPLKDILGAFFQLKNQGDEESWTNFLATFKLYADTLEKTTEWMSENHLHSKEVLLDSYLSDFHDALAQIELASQNEKSESAQLRSDALENQQRLEDSLKECLTLKDRKYPEDVSVTTTPKTSVSREGTLVLSRRQNPKPKMASGSLLASQHHLTSLADPGLALKPKMKDSMTVRQDDGDRESGIDGKQNKFTLKSNTRTERKRLP